MSTRMALIFGLVSVCVASKRNTADNRPNILLLFPDQWRFDWADQYYISNLSLKTPTFSNIVKNGTRFVHTCVGSPLCAPSRSCIASGKEYDYTGVPGNNYDLPVNETTIYNLMQDAGYWVMISGKDDLTKETGVGINGTYRQQELGYNDQRRCLGKSGNVKSYPTPSNPFAVYLNEHYNIDHNGQNETEWEITDACHHDCCIGNGACPYTIPVQSEAYEDNWITWNTLDMMNNIPDNKPWFLQINWAGPHPPFIILDSMNKSINNRSYPYPMNCDLDPYELNITRRDYSAEIENLDNQFKQILDKVCELGEYENTLICVSSDHGEMLGDYNAFDKSKPWVASSNIPFVCMGPDVGKGEVINSYVTNMDMAGTFLDYSKAKRAENMTTVSLRSFLNGTWSDEINEYRKYVSSGLKNWRMVVQDVNDTVTWKFICCQSQCPARNFTEKNGLVKLLFNIVDDLYEENNIIDQYPDVKKQMEKLLPPEFCVAGNYTEKWKTFLQINET
eukprot:359656_1